VDHTKINLLVRLQHLDNQIESIVSLQKGLPEEIDALDEDLVFTTRQIESRKKIADDHLKTRSRLHETINECKNKILNFKEKQTLARNNKEYDALSKQIEYEEKEIAQAEIQLQDLKKQVDQKKEELESIVIETAEDVNSLKKKVKEQRALITTEAKRLLDKYDHLRSGVLNNAVVKLNRNACSGCNTRVPTNRHTMIVQGGFYLCESCGRIVVHERLFEEAEE